MFKLALLLSSAILIQGVSQPQQYRERVDSRYRYKERENPQNQRFREPAENLYFVLSATSLPSKDANEGKADPYAKVYFGELPPERKSFGQDLDKIGETETIINDDNPKWLKVFKVQYVKGVSQKLWVEIGDHDPVNPDDIIGDAWIDLDEYVDNGHHLTVPIKGTKSGSLVIQNTAPFLFSLALKNVPHLDEFGGKSDPFIKCYFRYGKDGKDYKFYETEVINNVDSADWASPPIAFDHFQRGTSQFIHFVVKDSDSITADDEIGDALMDVEAFVDKKQTSVLRLSESHNATLYVKYAT